MFKRLVMMLALAGLVGAEQRYQSQGLSFELPLEFSQPARAGVDAQELHFPAEGAPEAEILTFVASGEQVRSLAEAGQSVHRYFLSTYLGLSGTPEQINKAVIGDVGGRHLVYHSQLNRPCRIDIFERDLKDGRYFAVALRSYESMDDKRRIEVSEGLRKSLRLGP